jgi:PhnB protein
VKTNGVKAVPEGHHTATPALIIRGAADAIEFYKKAFGAVEVNRFSAPGGQGIMHAQIRIGDSPIMLCDEFPNCGGKSPTTAGASTGSIYLYIEDVDSLYHRAVSAGAKGDMPPVDMFWGDRFAKVTDPFGHEWSIATHIEEVSPEEMQKRQVEFFSKMGKG